MTRGVDRQAVFIDEQDYTLYLEALQEAAATVHRAKSRACRHGCSTERVQVLKLCKSRNRYEDPTGHIASVLSGSVY